MNEISKQTDNTKLDSIEELLDAAMLLEAENTKQADPYEDGFVYFYDGVL